MSKLQSDALREAISGIMVDAKEKERKFVQTIELQIGLKNYDPQKDKRFSGSFILDSLLGLKSQKLYHGLKGGEMLVPQKYHGEAIPHLLGGCLSS